MGNEFAKSSSKKSISVSLKLVTAIVIFLMVMPMIPAQVLDDLVPDLFEVEAPIKETEVGPMGPMAGSYPALVNTTTSDWSLWPNSARKVVRTDNGTLHTTYSYNGEVWYSQSFDDGKNWVNHTNISNTGRPCWGSVIATNGTNVYIAYVDGDDIRFRRSLDGGATWNPRLNQPGTEAYNGGPGIPDAWYFSMDAEGDWVYIVHSTRNNFWNSQLRITRSNNGGQNWNQNQIINSGDDEWYPSVDVIGNTLYVAYQVDNGGADWEIWTVRSTNNGAGWGTSRRLTNNGANDAYPSIDAFNNNVSVAWQNDQRGNWEIFFTNSTDQANNWNANINITNTTDDSLYPSVVREDDVSYVIWQDEGDHASGDIFFAEHVNNVWSTPVDLTDSTDGNVLPNARAVINNNWLEYVYAENSPDPNNVVFNQYYVGPNTAPTLSYTGEAGYQADGLNPQGDTTGHTYEYRVDYTDSDNDPPANGYPEVWIDRNRDGDYADANEVYSMNEVNAQDTTYTDGKRYTFSTQFTNLGTYTYLFRAYDDKNWPATGAPTAEHTGPTITSFNVPPILEWLEIIDYENDGLNPEVGMVQDSFIYMIEYRDELNDPPGVGFPKVQFDMDGNGNFTDLIDEEASMVELTALDTTYDNGKVYTYNRTFTLGVYGYRFITEDSVGLTDVTEPRIGPTVNVDTEIPTLTFTGEPGYVTDGADPDVGSTNTMFTFKVVYTDADDDAPLNNEVLIGLDMDFNGTFEVGEWTVMTELDNSDTNFTDGKVYQHSTKFASLNIYNYTFDAKDLNTAPAIGEAAIEGGINIFSVNVNVINTPPVLKYTLEDNYTSDGLDPEIGIANLTEFVYRIKYEDENNHAPYTDYPQVGIDINLNGTFEDEEWFTMEEISPADTVFDDGKIYTFTHIFDDIGNYTYSFRARDQYDFATGAPTGVFDGPKISEKYVEIFPPELDWTGSIGYETDGVEPSSGTTLTEFKFRVSYKDADNDMPGSGPTLLVDVDGDGLYNGTTDQSHTMTEADPGDTDVTDGKVYLVDLAFADKGEYTYTMEAASTRSGETAFGPGTLVGTFTVSRGNIAPTLKMGYGTDGVDPSAGRPGDQFTYKVIYTDEDNDAPAAGQPKVSIDINGNGAFDAPGEIFTMIPVDTGDTDYTDGREYTYVGIVFAKEGTFKYMFLAEDNVGGVAADLEGTGPVVTIPEPNDPPELVFPADAAFKYDGLDPIKGKKGTVFTFRVTYIDVDGDEPQSGHPELWIDKNRDGDFDDADEKVAMSAEGSASVVTGRTFKIEMTLDPFEQEGDPYKYAFYVMNDHNQSARIGDFEGPVVSKAGITSTTPESQGLGDFLWLILVIIAAIVCIIIGFAAGRSKGRPDIEPEDTEPQYRESTGPMDRPPAEPYEPPAEEPAPAEPTEAPAEEPEAPAEPTEAPAEGPEGAAEPSGASEASPNEVIEGTEKVEGEQ